MTKNEMKEKLMERCSVTGKQALTFIDEFAVVVGDALLNDETVYLGSLGNLATVVRKPRIARNPRTGESVDVPEKRTVKFKPSKNLKKALNTN